MFQITFGAYHFEYSNLSKDSWWFLMDRLWSISFLMVLSVSALCVDVSRPASGGGALQPWTKEASLGSLVRRPRVPAWLSPQKVAWGQWKLKIIKQIVKLSHYRLNQLVRTSRQKTSSENWLSLAQFTVTNLQTTVAVKYHVISHQLTTPQTAQTAWPHIGTMSRPRLFIQCSRIPHHVQRRVAVTWHRTRFCGAQLQNELCKPCAVQKCSSNARYAYIC